MLICFLIFYYILLAYDAILLMGIILSWIPGLLKFKIFRIIDKIADWYLEPFSGILVFGPIDFTTLIGFAVYSFMTQTVLTLFISIISGGQL